MRVRRMVIIGLSVLLAAAAAYTAVTRLVPGSRQTAAAGIHKIKHVIFIVQENRSFDSYFGTYPGAVGIPMKNGVPTVCVPDPRAHDCQKPFPDHYDMNSGGGHGSADVAPTVDGGKMDGFVTVAETSPRGCGVQAAICSPSDPQDVMGYHTQSDIPNYWTYAKDFVLQDHMFESIASWSFPSHLFFLSAWAANCKNKNPMSCTSSLNPVNRSPKSPTPFSWTDITYLLDKYHVSWSMYLDHGSVPPKGPGPHTLLTMAQEPLGVLPIWNVLPGFEDVHQDGQTSNIQNLTYYFTAARQGNLPSVSWIFPSPQDSEHPPWPVSQGQSYVTNLINAAMRSPDWKSTAIFIVWDDWGGLYDNVPPPKINGLGYGLRVPALVISPYAKKGYIDHQTLSFDAYLKFIEDDFLSGQRLNPKTDGRPDSRPTVRESVPQLGNLVLDFNFNQKPRSPVLLPVHPKTTLIPGSVASP